MFSVQWSTVLAKGVPFQIILIREIIMVREILRKMCQRQPWELIRFWLYTVLLQVFVCFYGGYRLTCVFLTVICKIKFCRNKLVLNISRDFIMIVMAMQHPYKGTIIKMCTENRIHQKLLRRWSAMALRLGLQENLAKNQFSKNSLHIQSFYGSLEGISSLTNPVIRR